MKFSLPFSYCFLFSQYRTQILLILCLLTAIPRLSKAENRTGIDRTPTHTSIFTIPASVTTGPASATTGPVSETVAPVSLVLTPASAVVCSGGSVNLSLAGCPATGTISWSTGQTGSGITVKPNLTTNYIATCNVTGPLGSTTTASATVTVADPITITKGPSSLSTCGGSAVTFSVAATGSAISYRWFLNGVALTDPSASTPQLSLPNVSLSQAGNYVVSVSNQCGGFTSSAAQLTVAPGVVVGSSPTPAVCAGTNTGQIFATATGGTGPLQFQLNALAFQESNIFPNLKAGTYKLLVKDGIGCSAQTTVQITEPTAISLTVKAVDAKCSGGADGGLIVSASGGNGAPYKFQLNGATPQTGTSFFDLKDKTTYTAAAIDQLGCTTSLTVTIGAPQPFDIKTVIAPTKCSGSADGSISVSTTGGTGSYQYQIGTGAFQAGTLFTGLAASNYTINIKDAAGCLGAKTVAVPQPALLKLTAAVIPVNCFGDNSGSITLTPSGGTGSVQYQLTSSKTNQRSAVFKSLPMGDYTVVATDSNGCTALLPVTIGKADPLKVQASTVAASCCVCPTGRVVLTSGGGTGTGRQFQLVGRAPQSSNQFIGLPPGNYQFLVADEVGCTDSIKTVVTNATAMTLSPGTVKNVACTGGKDGEATVQITGGVKPFTFYWQTENRDTLKSHGQMQTGLAEGTYTVSVLDSNRCTTVTTFVTIKALAPLPPKPIITQTSTTLSIVDVTGVQWYVRTDTASAGKAVPNATQSTLTPFQSGRYYVIITQGGCASPPSDAVTFILTALPEPAATLSIRVMPNPISTDRLRVEVEQVERQSIQMQLTDASGRMVREYQIPAFTGKKQAEWPLSGLSSGLYLLKAEAGDRQSVIRLVVE